ncbi:MAG: tocopherol cyclase family protein [Saprospiraceae bacterium]
MKNTLRRWRATWNPDMYHGWGREKRYFEGWYFKLVDAGENHVFAVIPGISKTADGVQHAFIQVLDGKNCQASYHQFEALQFQPSPRGFQLQLGNNSFSADHVELDLPELQGRLGFKHRTPWPKMLGAPGIMGWYSFVPFMECYHGVVSLHHQLTGEMRVHGAPADFSGGVGYIEKDWGISFPRSWIWMQSNHFEKTEKICLMASVARIPWLGSYFIGYIVGFQWGERLFRFATYTGAQMKAGLGENTVSLSFRDRRYRVEIVGEQAPGAKLVSPITGNMSGKVNESMQGTLHVRFFESEKLLFEDTGRNAGLEIAGEVEGLLTDAWRR